MCQFFYSKYLHTQHIKLLMFFFAGQAKFGIYIHRRAILQRIRIYDWLLFYLYYFSDIGKSKIIVTPFFSYYYVLRWKKRWCNDVFEANLFLAPSWIFKIFKFSWRRWGFSLLGQRTLDPPLGPPSTLAEFLRRTGLWGGG